MLVRLQVAGVERQHAAMVNKTEVPTCLIGLAAINSHIPITGHHLLLHTHIHQRTNTHTLSPGEEREHCQTQINIDNNNNNVFFKPASDCMLM